MEVYLPFIPRLPSEYQEVEYIESSGTQYINTGVKPTNKTKVVNRGYGTSGIFYGVGISGKYQSLNLNCDTGSNYRGRCRSGSSSNSTVDSTVALGTTPHIFQISQGDGFYIDGTKIGTFTSYTFTETKNLYIFGWNNNGTFSLGGTARLYYMEIYENGTLVRDFIPCYRKNDSVIGLYDLVNNKFYTNAGTGTFSKGEDVTAVPLKNAYIGEVKEYSWDFTDGTNTIANLQSQGWNFNNKSPSISSSGLTLGTDGRILFSPFSISTVKKVTLEYRYQITSTQGNTNMGLGDLSGNTHMATGFTIPNYFSNKGFGVQLFGTLYRQDVSFGAGTYHSITVIDLESGELSNYLEGQGTKGITMSSSDISTIKNATGIMAYIGPSVYVKSLIITVEY